MASNVVNVDMTEREIFQKYVTMEVRLRVNPSWRVRFGLAVLRVACWILRTRVDIEAVEK